MLVITCIDIFSRKTPDTQLNNLVYNNIIFIKFTIRWILDLYIYIYIMVHIKKSVIVNNTCNFWAKLITRLIINIFSYRLVIVYNAKTSMGNVNIISNNFLNYGGIKTPLYNYKIFFFLLFFKKISTCLFHLHYK